MQIKYQEINSDLLEKICIHFGNEELIKNHIHLKDGSYSIAALCDDIPVGFISTYPEKLTAPLFSDYCAYINIIEVDENYRRYGIAKKMIDLTEKWAAQKGFSQISAWSSHGRTEAILMWRKLGYCMCPSKIWLDWCKQAVDGYYVTKKLNPTAELDNDFYRSHWYADIYEQKISGTDEADFALSLIKDTKADVKTILDVCCGGGRNSIPFAKAGYDVTGFDFDEYMLDKLHMRIENENIRNISWQKTNAVTDDWGKDFDVVVLAGNIFINIITESDYKQAQELFIKKATDCVKPGGYMYLDFDCSVFFHNGDEDEKDFKEWTIFEGTDDIGTYGKFIMMSDGYINGKRMDRRRYEITPKNGEKFSYIYNFTAKYFPTFDETKEWLNKYGWEILQLYGGRNKQPFDESVVGNRAVIWAKKIK